MQEAVIVLTLMLQRFELRMDDPNYQLRVKNTLTVKPDGFNIHARARGSKIVEDATPATTKRVAAKAVNGATPAASRSLVLHVLYGSNSGTCESFARRIASEAASQGYVSDVNVLDSAVEALAPEATTVIVTSSYDGTPCGNAAHFVEWIRHATSVPKAKFAVFGCGHRDWVNTYMAIPREIDEGLVRLGASRVVERGEGDCAGDVFGAFDDWLENFWQVVGSSEQSKAADAPRIQVELVPNRRASLLQAADLAPGTVISNIILSDEDPRKRFLEVELPTGMIYRAGDYLAILPTNPLSNVKRVLKKFNLTTDSQIVIRTDHQGFLPCNSAVSAQDVFIHYVELAQPITRRQLEMASKLCNDPTEAKEVASLVEPIAYEKTILECRVSLLDIIEAHSSCAIDLGLFLQNLPPMRIRQYSISSSPLWNTNKCTITIDVLQAKAWSGQGEFRGVASNFLDSLQAGDRISVVVRPSTTFHLPVQITTPLILVGAGSGIAPFRGFIQERALQIQAGRKVGPAYLFYGCRNHDIDYLHRDELEKWEALGAVVLKPAFSRDGSAVKYVQDRLWQDRKEVQQVFAQGAQVYICGSRKVGQSVKEITIKMTADLKGLSVEEATSRIDAIKSIRASTDIFG